MENASDQAKDSAYDALIPLMNQFGATCTPKEFYWAVNRTFHAAESKNYDSIHAEMFAEEEAVWNRLVQTLPESPEKLTVLDIGCGTGLVGGFLARFCAERIGKIHLLDPSAEMLGQAREKSANWPFDCAFHEGDIHAADIPAVDVATINSVMHHVVELESLLQRVQSVLNPGGVFLTSQDPRADAATDPVLADRRASLPAFQSDKPALRQRIIKSCKNTARDLALRLGLRKQASIRAALNESLLSEGVIEKPIDMQSVWAVTDFHVPGQTGGFGHGIDTQDMRRWMPGMQVQLVLTYHFHDTRWKDLSTAQRQQETRWLEANDQHGRQFASSWRKS